MLLKRKQTQPPLGSLPINEHLATILGTGVRCGAGAEVGPAATVTGRGSAMGTTEQAAHMAAERAREELAPNRQDWETGSRG